MNWVTAALGSSGIKIVHLEEGRPLLLVGREGKSAEKLRAACRATYKGGDTGMIAVVFADGAEPREHLMPDSAEVKAHRTDIGPTPQRVEAPRVVVDHPAIYAKRKGK